MAYTLGFDVYGTLIDPHGVMTKLSSVVKTDPQVFSQTWRDKQLEYSFRRGLMQLYADFSVCTAQALDYACLLHNEDLSDAEKSDLLGMYAYLPAFEDAKEGLIKLQARGHRLFAFSNGSQQAVTTVLEHAGLLPLFEGVVSVEQVSTFKPNPATYGHFMRTAQTHGEGAWLVSSNPFDIIGAQSAGMRGAWIQRQATAVFDPWGITPSLSCTSLIAVAEHLT